MRQLQSHLARVRRLADALLYEGYLLYPYRKSSQKNQRRWMFGTLAPRGDSEALGGIEPWRCQTECLLEADADATIEAGIRFLHFGTRLTADGSSSEEASERTVEVGPLRLGELLGQPVSHPFQYAAQVEGRIQQRAISGSIEISAVAPAPGVVRLSVQVLNLTPPIEDEVERCSALRALASVHSLLMVRGGTFVSQIDPEPRLQRWSAECRNVGLFPVLVGEPGARDLLLCSPIILSDYPQIAPRVPGICLTPRKSMRS